MPINNLVIIQKGIKTYLSDLEKARKINHTDAIRVYQKVTSELTNWIRDKNIKPQAKKGIDNAVNLCNWDHIVEAFRQDIIFGTGGIRGRTVLTENELKEFASKDFSSEILRGPNTINEIILMKYTSGVAKYMKAFKYTKAVIGYDSRLHGKEFADLVSKIFLANGITIYLFDEACPYPELSFAVTFLKADMGIEISASHNDKRYNGYKISNRFGASLGLAERENILSFIFGDKEKGLLPVTTKDIKILDFQSAKKDKLIFLGGEKPARKIGHRQLIDIHSEHLNAIKKFIIDPELVKQYSSRLHIGYCAYYGAGYKAVPRILRELGFLNVQVVHEMNKLNGWFPAFKFNQVIDPGDEKPARIGVQQFISEYGREAFQSLDIFLGTDPDADRLGVIVNIPEHQQKKLGKWVLLEANDVWTLLLWYRLKAESDLSDGKIPDASKKFIVRNHVTTDALMRVAKKFQIGCETTWVGFGFLAEKVMEKWKNGFINIGMFEESNGFSIGGGPPPPEEVKGIHGHTMEKDGILAAVLMLEVACYAKSQGKTIIDLLDELYLDPDIGFFATCKTQLPEEGVFEGVEGDIYKKNIIKNLVAFSKKVNNMASNENPYPIGDLSIKSSALYSTGKYDTLYWPGVPDEGIRFFLNESQTSHVTVRPSGTEAKLRYMVHIDVPLKNHVHLIDEKRRARILIKKLAEEFIQISQTGDIQWHPEP